jgi:hypothetical protein
MKKFAVVTISLALVSCASSNNTKRKIAAEENGEPTIKLSNIKISEPVPMKFIKNGEKKVFPHSDNILNAQPYKISISKNNSDEKDDECMLICKWPVKVSDKIRNLKSSGEKDVNGMDIPLAITAISLEPFKVKATKHVEPGNIFSAGYQELTGSYRKEVDVNDQHLIITTNLKASPTITCELYQGILPTADYSYYENLNKAQWLTPADLEHFFEVNGFSITLPTDSASEDFK